MKPLTLYFGSIPTRILNQQKLNTTHKIVIKWFSSLMIPPQDSKIEWQDIPKLSETEVENRLVQIMLVH